MANTLPEDAKPCLSSVDDNNNSQKYSLRPRATQRRSEEDSPPEEKRVTKPKPRSRREKNHPPLSKYRRKTANARERSRMREINEAFETLRKAIPQVAAGDSQSDKMTKISTLRLAMDYISALHRALEDTQEGDLLSDLTKRVMGSPPPYPELPFPSVLQQSLSDFRDLSLTPETTDQSLSSTSDVSDLFLISLDLDSMPHSDIVSSSSSLPDRTFAGLDHQFGDPGGQCSVFDDVLFSNGLR